MEATTASQALDQQTGSNGTKAGTERRRTHVPGFQLDCGTGPSVRHVGIVFVHGIGSQEPGETLLEWGGKIIGLLLDTRLARKASGDPVISCELDPGPGESRYIELQLPAAEAPDGTPIAEQHWVMTEAWWAQRVHPPRFGEMAEWLGPRGAISRILLAILPRGQGEHDARLRPSVKVRHLRRDDHGVEEADKHGEVYGEGLHLPDSSQAWRVAGQVGTGISNAGSWLTKVGAGLYLQAISALILVVYGALRSVEKILPIGPLRNGTLTRPIDEFMLEWFGDVYVLLRDPAQAASVRGRLVEAIGDLHANRCETVVVVAHSGGAIVSYMTLADTAKKDLEVHRLITLGEGLNLAWRITTGDDGKVDAETRKRYERLYTSVFDHRPELRWDDFWASQDPAPVGVLSPDGATFDRHDLSKVRSHAIWNRLAFGQDHGTYWENDEEFLIPMVRLLDESPPASSLFGTVADDRARSNRRRRRISMLSLWRQLSLVAPTAGLVMGFALGTDYIHRASDLVSMIWSNVPGADIVNGPLNTVRSLRIESNPFGLWLAETGVWVIAILLALVTIFALVAPPERPVPFTTGRYQIVGGILRLAPWALAGPIVVAVAAGALRFLANASEAGTEIGIAVGTAIAVLVVLAAVVYLMFGSPAGSSQNARSGRAFDVIEIGITVFVMVLAVFLATAPFVATIAYPEVGSTVLGSLTVLAAFTVIRRIGYWRWNVWDGRERISARTGDAYPTLARVAAQMFVLLLALALAFGAVVLDSTLLTWLAVGASSAAVLLGISVDVFDAARQKRTAPTDAMLRGAHLRSA